MLSCRGEEWIKFGSRVLEHIEIYTVPQYGDAPDDQVEDWSPEMCVMTIKKYCSRFGNNSREGQEKIDLLKIAHFAQIAYDKLESADV